MNPYSKNRSNSKQKISIETQAEMYLQLARLDEAGFPSLQAVELLLKTNKKARHQILQMQRFLKLGNPVADSGYKAGLFNAFDKAILQAGELSGNLGIIYKQLSRYYGQKVRRVNKLKSQCYLPIAVLVIALFVQPLPALVISEITGLDYLLLSVGRLVKICFFIYTVLKLPSWLTQGWLQFLGLKNGVYSLQLKLPLLSSWIIARQLNEFLLSLGLMLNAGVAILDALPKALNTIKNPLLRKQFEPVILMTQQGSSLVDALTHVPDMSYQAIQLLLVGEKSGKLAQSILQHVKIEQENINLKDELLAEWIPRIFYFIVTLWVASSIIIGNSMSTVVGI